MDNRPIGVFDSGVGGFHVLYKLANAFPSEDFIYLGDNKNVPYGNREPSQIIALVEKSVQRLIACGVKLIVLGCNTASALYGEREISGVKILPLSPVSTLARVRRNCVFLSTTATANFVRAKLGEKDGKIVFFPMPNLAEKIEKQVAMQKKVVFDDHPLTTDVKAPVLYLGCTHYLYLKEYLKGAFEAEVVLDGIDDLVNKIGEILDNTGISGQNIQTVSFVGDCAEDNKKIFFSANFTRLYCT